jgi:predicted short-subunit dehydrogenase-like oxidoreductase (DUF2520 family)
MKKVKSVALIGAGNFTDSPLQRFWGLSERLGPVKASSFRLASRIANRLRAGYAVKQYGELDSCRLILVCVPDTSLPQLVAEMVHADISWKGKAVVLCSTWLDSSALREFGARGAAVGSISPIPGFDEQRYLVEGDKLAVRESRLLVEHGNKRAISIERPLKPFYLTALTCTGSLLFALVLAAAESLRHAGVPPSFSFNILEKQLEKSLRSYVRGGRRAFQEPRELSQQLRALSGVDPALARYIEQSCGLATRWVEER